jgi:hypothetical protein
MTITNCHTTPTPHITLSDGHPESDGKYENLSYTA